MEHEMHHNHSGHHGSMGEPKHPWIITLLSFGFLFLCAYLTSLYVPISFQ